MRKDNKFLFSKNINQELSNALPPMSFGPIVAEILSFEVSEKISKFQFFQKSLRNQPIYIEKYEKIDTF